MGYTPELKKQIERVEATRPRRIADVKANRHFARISEEDGMKLLRQYHPDYKENAKRKLRIGPNAGDIVPSELADVLEAKSRIDPETIALDKIDHDVDVLIIGGGGAASAAALVADENGAGVLMATKLRHGDANTMMAEGGIQSADKSGDSPMLHYLDAMGGGHFTNDPDLLMTLVHDAPEVLAWLENLGVMFDKNPDGSMQTLHGGGTSRKRMHSAGDMTGAARMRTLRDEVRNRPQIRVVEFSPAVELLLDKKGRCTGALLVNMETSQQYVVRAKSTIIATGGFGRLHIQGFNTTNHYGATADGLVIAYRAGCALRDMGASQFHPTGVIYPEQNVGLLITEKVRGAGAQVLNVNGEQFCYPLEPRDVESAALIRECEERGLGIKTPTGRLGVWLDSPMIDALLGPGTVQQRFPAKFRQFKRHDIDVSKEPMLVYPTLHYQNGGIAINPRCETKVEGLYVAGEATGGVHGINRLMGNSLLDIMVYGRIAGRNAAEKARSAKPGDLSLAHVREFNRRLEKEGVPSAIVSPILLPNYAGRIG